MKKTIFIITVVLVLILSFFIYPKVISHNDTNPIKEFFSPKKESDEELLNKKVEETLSQMTLDEKIAGMMIIDIQKPTLEESDYTFLKEFAPGGFILFSPNITTYQTTLKEIKKIKETSKIPLFISIDEEGGKVARLDSLQDIKVTKIPEMYSVGKTDASTAYEVGKILGYKLGVFGINMDFAPCADIYSNPQNTVIGKRAFGSEAALVSTMSENLAKGLLETGIIPVYKHFPGHGDTATDSHYGLPIIEKNYEQLLESELKPFLDAIKNNAEVIMVGHLAVPQITGDTTPASLSKVMIDDILKTKMGYKNLVITDSLKMGAITSYYTESQIYEMAINAGVDILLMPKDPQKAFEVIKDAINKGTIKESQIDESIKKILKLKYKMIENNYNTYLPSNYLNSSDYNVILDKIA